MIFWLVACSDYGIKDNVPKGLGDTAGTAPEITVSPWSLELGVQCADVEKQVELSNTGGSDLSIIALTLTGQLWSVSAPDLPLVLTPGESTEIRLTGGPGTTSLQIESSDPLNPVVEVPISSNANSPPTVEIIEPANPSILNGGEYFRAQITDDLDLPPYMAVQWASNVDGVFGSTGTDASGIIEGLWSNNHTAGDHLVGIAATDNCNETKVESISICHKSSYSVDNLDLSTWQLEGSALWDNTNNWLQITDTQPTIVGSAFQTSQTVTAEQVELEFQFYIGDGTGADGFAVVALDTQRMAGFIGSAGGCLGYGSGEGCDPILPALPGWVIEIDTYYNSQWDPTESDHIAFMFDGRQDQIEAWAELPELEDTGWHTMQILINAPRVTATINGSTVLDQELNGYFGFPAYIGFTGSTGGLTNQHLISALSVTETSCNSN